MIWLLTILLLLETFQIRFQREKSKLRYNGSLGSSGLWVGIWEKIIRPATEVRHLISLTWLWDVSFLWEHFILKEKQQISTDKPLPPQHTSHTNSNNTAQLVERVFDFIWWWRNWRVGGASFFNLSQRGLHHFPQAEALSQPQRAATIK